MIEIVPGTPSEVPSDGAEPTPMATAPPSVTQTETTGTTQEETPSTPTTETTTTETTPTLPGSEATLPFTGGRPLGFWILGALVGMAGAGTLFASARRQRRAARGEAQPLKQPWIPYTTGTTLVLVGVLLASYPAITDLRYLFTQQAMAAEGAGQQMPGDAVARIVIPEVDLDAYVLEGTDAETLDQAPGHYPGTPLPGESGNSAIAGHRTMYGHPFNRLNELEPGDEITTYTSQGMAVYRVMSVEPCSPTDVGVAEPQGDDRLTLTTCHPVGSAEQRLVVAAALVP